MSKERKKQLIAENTTLFASSVYFSCPVDGRAPILCNSFLDSLVAPFRVILLSLDSKMPFSCLNFVKCSSHRIYSLFPFPFLTPFKYSLA